MIPRFLFGWGGFFGGGSSSSDDSSSKESASDYKSSGNIGKDINDISEVAKESGSSFTESAKAGADAKSDKDYDSPEKWEPPSWVPDWLRK